MWAFLTAIAPAAAANAVTGTVTSAGALATASAVAGTAGRIVVGAVVTKIGADIARPALERVLAAGARLALRA